MSTSPSWFDQEKFSRLVKKVGPKSSSGRLPPVSGRVIPPQPPEKETRRLQRTLVGEGRPSPTAAPSELKSTAPENAPPPEITVPTEPIRATPPPEPSSKESDSPFNFPPPMPLPEIRSVSPLSRRTTPLPNLKSIFEYEKPADRAKPPEPESSEEPGAKSPSIEPPPLIESALLKEATSGSKPPVLPDQPEFPGISARAEDVPSAPAPIEVRPSPIEKSSAESGELEQLKKERADLAGQVEELSKAASERDASRAEIELLRTQLRQADEILQATGSPGDQLDDMTRAIEERDASRRDYAKLREDFENLKKEQGKSRAAFLTEGGFGSAVTANAPDSGNNEELTKLKATVGGLENSLASLKRELDGVQKQVAQARDEASVAQRGLALSQRALQETRDALREASEASSTSKANADKLKSECASLAQRNASLQLQMDGLARELGAAKGKSGPT